MKGRIKYRLIVSVIVILAASIRLLSLSNRPMHTDEAVHAFKFADLLENGNYIYDRNEYHGPTLYYLSLIPAWINSQHNLVSLDETTLRIIPALAGVAVILLLILLAKFIGWPLVLGASFLLAFSPALVFYSRYYIHETLLIFFNAGLIIAFFRYFRSKKPGWIILAGLFAGLMVSTKETWVIIIVSQLIAYVLTKFYYHQTIKKNKEIGIGLKLSHLAVFFLVSGIVAVSLFSSFFKNPTGITDSIVTYSDYFGRATDNSQHNQPWYYYFILVITNPCNSFLFRADIWLLTGGFSGMALVFLKKPSSLDNYPFLLFISLYALITAVIFSVIPYKTPWNILAFYTPLAFLAAWFFYFLSKQINQKWLRSFYLLAVSVIIVHLSWQSYYDNFKTYDHPCNPYVYSHPNSDVKKISKVVEKIIFTAPEGKKMFIDVIVPEDGYWPLPWYFRRYPNVGWWNAVDITTPAAPLIICAPEYSQQLTKKLFEIPAPGKRFLYIPVKEKISLRPGTNVSIYLRKDYWDRYRKAQTL